MNLDAQNMNGMTLDPKPAYKGQIFLKNLFIAVPIYIRTYEIQRPFE